jgi:filamentous hemagglutinin family protein
MTQSSRAEPARCGLSARRFALLASVSAFALMASAGPVFAVPLASASGAGGAATAAAAAAAAAAASVAQAQQITQQSMSSLLRATQAVQAMQQAQAAARTLAQKAPSGVPNGLMPGGLVPDSGLAAPGFAAPVTTWIGANTPVQSSANGQTLVTVQQTQQKAIANWSNFNVGQNTTLYFNQSAGNSSAGNNWVVLNRVQDPTGVPSQILGEIKAEGSVYVIDHNGIVFGGASQVNVSSLIASSLNLFSNDITASNNRFLNGGIGDLNQTNYATDGILLTSDAPGAGNVTIQPGASINLGNQGLAVIAAPNVTNGGTITAPSGQVALIAGIGVSYDYNATSFNAEADSVQGSSQGQGFNNNTTTMLRFANYGTLTDSQGNDITPIGTLTNNGMVLTTQGDITMLGGVVQQNGVAVATTSVKQPGSIVIESLYEVGRGVPYPADESDLTFYTGSITFGPQAVTAILPDSSAGTLASDATSLTPWQSQPTSGTFTQPLPTQGFGVIDIIGQSIDFQSGTLAYAPGQSISANAIVLADPRVSVPGAGRVMLENGAILDVSGIPGTQLSAAANLLTVTLGGNELADSPLQQDDALYGASVTVDMRQSGTNAETGESWVGTPLANLTGYLNLEQQSIGQLLTNGGTLSIGANEFVGEPGSIINLTGGYVEYLGGMISTTRLISTDGGLYGIGNADPDLTYVGIAGEFSVDHTHWGVTETFTSSLLNGGYYEPAYVQGGNAGTLNINIYNTDGSEDGSTIADSGAVVLDSTLLAASVAGTRQIALGSSDSVLSASGLVPDGLPINGTFDFAGTSSIEISSTDVLSPSSLAATSLPADFGMTSPFLAGAGSAYAAANVFNADVLNSADFANISLSNSSVTSTSSSSVPKAGGDSIIVDADTSLTVQPGGSISLKTGDVTINGDLTARAGTIAITTSPVIANGNGEADIFDNGDVPGDIVIGSGAVLDVSGLFFNESPAFGASQNASASLINGGSIALTTNVGLTSESTPVDLTGNITLAAGSFLDLEGGGRVQANGTLETDSNGVPVGTGGNLTLKTYAGVNSPLFPGQTLTRGTLTLNGTIDALGFNGGGTLTLQAPALQIGGDPAAIPADTFYFDPARWGDAGFDNFALSAVSAANIPADAIVRLTHENLLPDLTIIAEAPSGSDPAAYASAGFLSGMWLAPTNLSINSGLELQNPVVAQGSSDGDATILGQGAEILADPGAAITLDSVEAVTVLGSISAHGGSISLAVNYPNTANSSGPYGPLYIGAQSVLDVSGTSELDPLPTPVLTAFGGKIYIVQDTTQALQDAKATFDLATYVPTVTPFSFSEKIDPQLPAGTMLFGADTLDGSGFSNLNLTNTTGIVAFAGQVAFSLNGSVTMTASDFAALNAGNFVTNGGLIPSLPLIQDPTTGTFPTTDGASLTLTAPYISLVGGPGGLIPSTADGVLTLNANDIDLVGANGGELIMANIGQANFNSSGDIRLMAMGSPTSSSLTANISGSRISEFLQTGGSLTFAAADIYPTTDTAFTILAPDGTVTFTYPTNGGPSTTTPLSADGALTVTAPTIIQDGEIQAPFGTITLGATGTTTSVTLGAGSITSVSANGTIIPFGSTVDQTSWIYNPQLNNPGWYGGTSIAAFTTPLTGAPQGVIALNGDSISFNSGAVVNLSGGGDLQAQEWVPGTGGSRNVLLQYQTSYQNSTTGTQVPTYPDARQIFAILPGYSGSLAPYDSTLSQSGMVAGEAIYLAGGNGLPAGVYTLLPAQYATLPGAYRVVANSGVTNPLVPDITLADGTMEMAGTTANTVTGTRGSTELQFYVQSASVWELYSQYALTRANSFFPNYAALNSLAMPYTPVDSGRLAISATTGLSLSGTVLGAPGPGGFGAEVDISGQSLEVTDNASGTHFVTTGTLDFGAPNTSNTLVNGATVTFTDAAAGDTFTVTGTGTLVVLPGGSVAQVVRAGSGLTQITTAQSVSIPAGGSFETFFGASVIVSTTGVDTAALTSGKTITLPASSSTVVTLPALDNTLTYSFGSGIGGNLVTVSSPAAFTVNGVIASLNPTTHLYTTTTYAASQAIGGTVAGQAITWTTGSSVGTTTGAGGTLTFSGTGTSVATLGTTLTNGSSTYVFGFGSLLTAMASSDQLLGNFEYSGPTPAGLLFTAGSYTVSSGEQFSGFSASGTSPVAMFTASATDTIAYTGGTGSATLATSQNYLELSAQQLDGLGVASLLIGGTRSFTSNGMTIVPTANNILVDNDANVPLIAPEIMLVATPQFQSTTVDLDNERATATIETPVAGTGEVVLASGSVVEAAGSVGGQEPTALILGSALKNLPTIPGSALVSDVSGQATTLANYYTALDAALGTLVRVSTGDPVTVQLPSTAELNPGSIAVTDNVVTSNPTFTVDLPSLAGVTGSVIEAGAQLLGGNALTLASTGASQIQAGALLSGTNIQAESSTISFLGSGAAPASGAVIDPATLVALQNAQTIDLQSTGTIAFDGNVTLALTGGDGSLTLSAGALTSDGGTVAINAPTLVLDNELAAAVPSFAGGSGELAINVGTLAFGEGAKTLSGFGSVSVVASRGVIGQGSGSMDFGNLPLTLNTPIVVADTGSTQTLTTTGALAVVPTAGTALVSDALGGAITLQGGSVTISTPIQATGGNITLDASAGDVTVTGSGSLTTEGVAKDFVIATEFVPAGAITLSASQGTVNVESGAVLNFSGAAAGGDAGSLSITTSNSTAPVQLDGTMLGSAAAGYNGGSFTLDSSGAVALNPLVQILTQAGVTGAIGVQSAVGNLSLSGTLTASTVELVANGGTVTVNGAITANGTTSSAPEIDLFGSAGVDVEGKLVASGATGGVIIIGTSGIGSTTSLNATYGYENVDPTASGTITIGANAYVDASSGTVTLRTPILDAVNDWGINVNVKVSPGATILGSAVDLDAYAVWSTADQSTNLNQHFDGYIDPAGWYDSSGNLVSGVFKDASGNVVLTYTAGTMTTAQLATYLTNDYFTPDTYYAQHAVFYGGYNPNNETFNPSAPDAGTVPAFIQSPGFVLGSVFAGVANFQARPEVDLINPSVANGGVNGGNITVLTNWNLGAGVMNADGSFTLAYRYQGSIAPVIGIRAAGNVVLDASITDGFFQTAGVSIPDPATLAAQAQYTYGYVDQLYQEDLEEFGNFSTTQILYYDGSSGPLIGAIDPNVDLNAPQQGGSTLYYQNYLSYLTDWQGNWAFTVPDFNGIFSPVTAPAIAAPTPPSASDPNYATDYQNYLTAYSNWLQNDFTPSNYFADGTPTAPVAPANPAQYLDYTTADENYINYIFGGNYYYVDPVSGGIAFPWVYAPTAPGFVASSGIAPPPLPIPAGANSPSNMPTAANPFPVQFASLLGGQSSSYQIVAGANLASANPLAVVSGAAGNVTIDDHTAYTIANSYEIVAPTTIRTGSGSIAIAAAQDFALLDTIAPGVVYTAGVPVQPASAEDGTAVALGNGAFKSSSEDEAGISTILTPAVDAYGAGNISLTVGGDIIGIEDVTDALATSGTNPSGLTSNPGAFVGQFWDAWLLTNPNASNIPWYVNFGSFDQGIMSVGGNVKVKAGGDIRDLAVSLPTTALLDSSDILHVFGGGNLSVSAGDSIYSGDFYVGQGTGTINAGGTIASDFNFTPAIDPTHTYEVATLLAVQYGTINVDARVSADIGGVYNPTYLFSGTNVPVASYAMAADPTAIDLMPYVTSMSTTSGVSVEATSGDTTFNSLLAETTLFSLGDSYPGFNVSGAAVAAGVSSLLLPASLNLVAVDGAITVDYGGGLYPSATGTLTLVADQSINLAVPLFPNSISTTPVSLPGTGNVFGTSLGKLDYPVGTGILPTASDPTIVPVWNLSADETNDPSLIQASQPLVVIAALNGSLVDGTASNGKTSATSGGFSFDYKIAAGGTVDQIALIPNAPTEIYAGQDILDLPFYGENFAATDVTSIVAGQDIRSNPLGEAQSATIELAGPGSLVVEAGRNISFQSQRVNGANESGVRTIGNTIDTSAYPILNSDASISTSPVYPYDTDTNLADFGNPYLPKGGASVNVLFGVGPGIDQAAFVNQYIDPANASAMGLDALTGYVTAYEMQTGHAVASLSADQAWAIFRTLPEDQQQFLIQQVFFSILNQTGLDYNDPSSSAYHSYAAGYQAINTLFPASYGYTQNSLDGGTNGANQLVSTGTLDMRGSTIQTQQGGSIAILGPGGRILVGSADAAPAVNPASEGILTLESGDIDVFTDQDVLVAQSRIMTEEGGNIVMWSSNGNLDAGKGAKTSVSAPPPKYDCDIDWICSADIKGEVSGAGIATLQSLIGVPVGNANLIAPRGTVNAGAAGVRVSGNLNIAALQVLNAFNIQVQGVTTGVTAPAPNVGSLSDASAASGAATKAITANTQGNANSGQPSILIVEIEGYGGDDADTTAPVQPPAEQKYNRQSYDENSRFQVVGAGSVNELGEQILTPEEKQKLSQH